MIRSAILTMFAFVASTQPVNAQFFRPPVMPHVPVHIPHFFHAPHAPGEPGSDGSDVVLAVVAGLLVLIGGGFLVHSWRNRPGQHGVIRVVSVPPGEAPESVRRAWVGLDLPLLPGQDKIKLHPSFQVLSGEEAHPVPSYAVDGQAAVRVLRAAHPEAAEWWQVNAKWVMEPGAQFVFPATVCERLDDRPS